MREFIKKGIREKLGVEAAKVESPETVPNETIVEYASLFPELDKLTMEGTVTETRELDVEVPLDKTDDDVELESIEYNIADGKVGDVRSSNTAQDISESYNEIRTYDQFYQEALTRIERLPRESDDGYSRRVHEYADAMYNEYCTEAAELGLPGFDKISIGHESVPSKLNVNFGAMDDGSSDNFVTKVNAFFATDEKHNITRKQLDSIELVKQGALKNMGPSLKAYMENAYNYDHNASVWDAVTPKTIIVPKGNIDSFCVVVEYVNELTGKNEYFGWTAPISTKEDETVQESFMAECEKANMASFYNEDHFENHDRFVIESARIEKELEERFARRVRPQRFYQEAIEGLDTEGGDTAPAADTSSTDAPAETGGSVDTGSTDDAATDAPAEGGEGETEKKPAAAVNDVSAEIADKVASDTQDDAMTEDETITFSDETNPESNVNVADGGDVDETSVEGDSAGVDDIETTDAETDADSALDELDDLSGDSGDEASVEGEDETSALDTGDVDNMSVNELLELGKESLKNMKVGELKDLIAKGDNETITEAFILTPKNVCKEIDIKLRDCLGVLNDNSMEVDKLLGKFKHKGHKLNRTLSKAVKMKSVFSSDEAESIKKLNTSLGELLLSLRKKPENYASAIKTKIKDFTNEAKVVGAIVEDKLGKQSTEGITQEAFLLGNVESKISKALVPVMGQMATIIKLSDEGNLTRGRLRRMYAASGRISTSGGDATNTSLGGTGTGTLSAKRNMFTGITEPAADLNKALKLLNKALRKKDIDKIDIIEKLADKLDLISDFIESLLDGPDNPELLKRISALAAEIIDLSNEYLGPTEVETADEPIDEPVDDTAEDTDDAEDTASVPDDDEKEIEPLEEDDVVVEDLPEADSGDDDDKEEDE